MTLTGSNVGIGTSAPLSNLHVKGSAASSGTGTISSSGTTVTGSSSAFNTQLNVGDAIIASNQTRIVTAIASAAALSTDTAFSPVIGAGTAFTYQRPILRLADSTGAFPAIVHATGLASLDNSALGALWLPTDAGVVTWTDLPVTSAASAATKESYSAQIDGNAILTVYGESDGAGGTQNRGVAIGTTVATPAFLVAPPATQTIAATNTVTADACGTIKRIDAASSVTTNTTNTFTAPVATQAGCCMIVANIDTVDTVTLDANANFKTAGGTDVAVGPYDSVEVCSTGSYWFQASAVVAAQ
jgi:hypothetical protein